MASRRKRGPVAFRPRLLAGLALSIKYKHTPEVILYQGSPALNLSECRMSALGRERTLESLDSSPSLLHCMSPLWVVSGHSEALKTPDGRFWGRGFVRECLLSARSGQSIDQKSYELIGCFRPEAAARVQICGIFSDLRLPFKRL